MSNKRYKVKKDKPIFNTRKQGNSFLGIIIMVILLAALVFVGYSVGKPILEHFRGEEDRPSSQQDDSPSVTGQTEETIPVTTDPEDETDRTEQEEEEPEVAPVRKNILYISYPQDVVFSASYESMILSRLESEDMSGYYGVCIDLVLDGGEVTYQSENTTAIESGAVIAGGISDLKMIADAIREAGLVPYARVSALSDHIVSWYDKSTSYMFENSDSRWLDNTAASGGKPWLSPFSNSSREYMNAICSEISEAGFVGMIAGELEFPPFRSTDLNYIGQSVKDENRYTALVDFSTGMRESFGEGNEFYIEVSARDIIAGSDEILTAPDSLPTDTVYVRFDPDEIGVRVSKEDGGEVSFEGLNEVYLLKTVFMLVNDSLEGSGLNIVPLISGVELTDDFYDMLNEIGYSDSLVIISQN